MFAGKVRKILMVALLSSLPTCWSGRLECHSDNNLGVVGGWRLISFHRKQYCENEALMFLCSVTCHHTSQCLWLPSLFFFFNFAVHSASPLWVKTGPVACIHIHTVLLIPPTLVDVCLPTNVTMWWMELPRPSITLCPNNSSLTPFPGSTTLSATEANTVSADSGVMSFSLNTYEVL